MIEWHWALRNLRARGWRAVLAVALLAVALGANAVLFAVADSLVFRRVPYPGADRLVEIQVRGPRSGPGGSPFLTPALLDEWRKQNDLFTGVEGYLTKTLFLTGGARPESIGVSDVTVGLFELLGVRPRWGRPFAPGDEQQIAEQPVLMAETLALERFGNPAAAVGQRIATSGENLIVIGVMPATFRFPEGTQRIWRALDPRGPLARGFAGVSSIARVRPDASATVVAQLMEARSDAIAEAAGARRPYAAMPGPLRATLAASAHRGVFLVLLGASACLLLMACANIASLELATAVRRARLYAIQLAIGATRSSLARVTVLEGLILVAASAAAATVMAHWATAIVAQELPVRMANSGANPIDVDLRVIAFMSLAAVVATLLSSAPIVVFASRAKPLDLLKQEGLGAAGSGRGAFFRQVLTVLQVAATVTLLVASVTYLRSYVALLALDTGFDSAGLVSVNLSIPPQSYSSAAAKRALAREAVERLRARPGVLAAAPATPPPGMGAAYGVDQIEIPGRPPTEERDLTIAELDVEPGYFETTRIPLLAGRDFLPGEPADNVIVSESFASRHWTVQSAVGQSYRRDPRRLWLHVVGVAGHVRSTYDLPGERSHRIFQTYVPRQPPPPPQPATRQLSTGGSFGFVTLLVRVDSRARLADVQQTVQAIESSFILNAEFVDDIYARQFEDRLLALRVVSAYGSLAFLVAGAGIYGFMAFLVAHRTREIGIRMALGATPGDVRQLIVGLSFKLALAGAVLGVGAAIAASRWMQAQLFAARTTDAGTILAVAAALVLLALAATWRPARQATRVDPTVLLRRE